MFLCSMILLATTGNGRIGNACRWRRKCPIAINRSFLCRNPVIVHALWNQLASCRSRLRYSRICTYVLRVASKPHVQRKTAGWTWVSEGAAKSDGSVELTPFITSQTKRACSPTLHVGITNLDGQQQRGPLPLPRNYPISCSEFSQQNIMKSRELRKFPKGEHCSECPARRWYLESGFRYCQNGHRVEVCDCCFLRFIKPNLTQFPGLRRV
jgi:hypothetical protein